MMHIFPPISKTKIFSDKTDFVRGKKCLKYGKCMYVRKKTLMFVLSFSTRANTYGLHSILTEMERRRVMVPF